MSLYRPTLLIAMSFLAACGSTDSKDSADTTLPPATTITTLASPATSTTELPTTTELAEPQAYAETDRLREGVFYTAGDVAIGAEIRFTATDKSRYSFNLAQFFSVQTQASGDETLLYLADLSTAFVFKNPLDDLLAYGGDNSALLAASDPIPDDYLAYVANLPGVTVGPVTETQFAGFTARSMTYEVGDFAGVACIGSKLCLLTLFLPTGSAVFYYPGDNGTLYVFELNGRTVLADVIGDGAEEFLATMTITV